MNVLNRQINLLPLSRSRITRVSGRTLRLAGEWLAQRVERRGVPRRDLRAFSRINYGCGYDKLADHLNVDMDLACEPDLLIVNNDTSMIPLDHFEAMNAKDVLEHIPRSKTLEALLQWASWLKIGASLRVQTSSILAIADHLSRQSSFAEHYRWTHYLFGTQAHPGDFHYTGFTELGLWTYLAAAGFEVLSHELRDEWMFDLQCRKVEDWCEPLRDRILPDDAFIERAYQQALHRAPDHQDLTHCREALAADGRRQLLLNIWASQERLQLAARPFEARLAAC